MATWESRGLRGSQFESMINSTNEKYRELGLAVIQKIPTPIKPVEIDGKRHITLAYFEQRSTVDYIGVCQTYPVCFDAKEIARDLFPIANIHEHQYNFMKEFEVQGGIAFLLINYIHRDKVYYMRFCEMDKFYRRALSGGRKSFTIDELDNNYFIEANTAVPIHYLEKLNLDLREHNKK